MINDAVRIIKEGGVIVYPTDTVWGLGCNALDKDATQKLLTIKQKPEDSKLIWLFSSVKLVKNHFGKLDIAEEKLLNKKHITVIIDGQGVRVVKNGWINKFVTRCGVPIVSTSANIHGEKILNSWRQAAIVFNDKVDAVIKGPKIIKSIPSTVVTIENGQTKILRAGNGISIK